ncbi:MAG: hypothetical protein Q8N95_05480 [Desulfobacterales bacterium]|nr:hypothetical protein [Desulfobacterales bacterium]
MYSEKGKGSTFNIYLPACENMKDDKKKETDRRISGTGTILFVDDEKMIIDVGQAILKKPGYDVRSRYEITITFLTISLRLLMPVTAFQCYGYF